MRKDAETKVEDNEHVSFVFADINNNIEAKLTSGKLVFFNSLAELDKVLNDLV